MQCDISPSRPELWLFVSLWAILLRATTADCFSHNGVLATDSEWYHGPELVSCGRGTNNCCLKNQQCGSNLLCRDDESGRISRQYCEDAEWDNCSSLCPSFEGAGVLLTSCDDNVYCCPDSGPDCCTNGPAFYIDPDSGAVLNTAEGASHKTATYWSVRSQEILAAAAEPTTTSTTHHKSTSIPAETSADTTPAASSRLGRTGSSGLSAGAGAGIGVGGAVAGGLVGVLIWRLVQERKRRRRLEAAHMVVPGQSPSQPQPQLQPQPQSRMDYAEYYAEAPDTGTVKEYRQELPAPTTRGLKMELEA